MRSSTNTPRHAISIPAAGVDFTAIYAREFTYVWQTLRRFGVPERDRPDVAHDVFVTAWRRMDAYDRARPFRPWLCGITFREAVAYGRRASTVRETITTTVDREDLGPSPETQAAERQMRLICRQALGAVPLPRRAVLVMSDLDGTSVWQIARALGIPLMTVYSRLRVGRKEWVAEIERLRGGAER